MKKFRSYYLLLLLIAVVYILELWLIPPDAAALTRYDISPTKARLISISLAIPVMAIWYIAFYGFIKVKQYTRLAGDTRDGHALNIISQGLMVLAISLPIQSIIGNLRLPLIREYPQLLEEITIAYNYFSIILALISMWLISHGARQLFKTLKKKPYSFYQGVIAAVFTAFCFVYTYVTLIDSQKSNSGPVGTAAYFLPDFLVFSTIVVPYILLWFLGLRAAYHIQLYRKNVPGVLYREALGYLAAGIATVALTQMVLRILVSLSSFLNTLSLRYLLVLIYALLVIIGISFVLIAIGAKKLKKIEEV